ncbi:hypothetical protein TNCV_3856361 [Trichonephila clavipes]|nr:hypothetical protein TNCV_3856361 [Trichonephila clavipes]
MIIEVRRSKIQVLRVVDKHIGDRIEVKRREDSGGYQLHIEHSEIDNNGSVIMWSGDCARQGWALSAKMSLYFSPEISHFRIKIDSAETHIMAVRSMADPPLCL